jgi:hypothetical protein
MDMWLPDADAGDDADDDAADGEALTTTTSPLKTCVK